MFYGIGLKNGETTVVSRAQTKFSAPLNQHRPIRRRAPTGEVEEEEVKGRKDRSTITPDEGQHPKTDGRDHRKPPKF